MRKYLTEMDANGRLDVMSICYTNARGEVVTSDVEYEDYSGTEAQSVSMMDRANDVYEDDVTDSGEYVKDDGKVYGPDGESRINIRNVYIDGEYVRQDLTLVPVRHRKDRDWNLSLDDNGDVTIFAGKTGWYVRGAGKCRIQICEYEAGWKATCSCGQFSRDCHRQTHIGLNEYGEPVYGPVTYEDASRWVLHLCKFVALHAAQAYNETVGRRSHVDYDL